jgi:hypothetical protein
VRVRWLVALVTLVACGSGSPARTYPRMVARESAIAWRDCAGVRAFVRKSGRQGLGVTIELRTRRQCAVTVARAELVLSDGARARAEVPPAAPPGRSLIYLWTPIRFDATAAWLRGVRGGQLELDLVVDGAAQPTVVIHLVQA